MKYGSVCSGIEAASVAWHSLGWEAQWYSEIEHFPSEVLKHRFPDVPNLGDMTQLTSNPTFNEKSIDLLVGGTPCQSFSVAGLRGGLADPRGNLMLTFLALADAKKPKWIVWENVPGVLSSNGGRDFGTFLTALGNIGYGFAYRVLDAQHFGVAQRRRRVFVVGHLGDWRPAAAVLFESESLQRDSKPSRAKRQETPTDAEGSVRATSPDGRETIGTLRQRDYKGIGNDDLESGRGLAIEIKDVSCAGGNVSPCVTSKWKTGYGGPSGGNETRNMVYEQVAQPIMLDDQGGSVMRVIEDGVCGTLRRETHGHEPLVAQPIAYSFDSLASNSMKSSNPHSGCREVETSKTIDTTTPEPSKNQGGIAIAQPVHAFKVRGGCEGGGKGYLGEDEKAFTISTMQDQQIAQPIAVDCFNQTINEKTSQTIGSSASDVNHYGAVLEPTIIDRAAFNQGQNAQYEPRIEAGQTMSSLVAKGPHAVQHTMAIRRLTPVECEKLQGFPPNWTKIPYRNKPADQCPDGPRYKACGNSMAVPVMRWIGQRIEYVESLMKDL